MTTRASRLLERINRRMRELADADARLRRSRADLDPPVCRALAMREVGRLLCEAFTVYAEARQAEARRSPHVPQGRHVAGRASS
jgi:hypothetical protein